MSSLMRPAGRLPRRVYWARRLVVVAVVVLSFSVLWWVFAREGGGGGEDRASPAGSAPVAGGVATTTSAGVATSPREVRDHLHPPRTTTGSRPPAGTGPGRPAATSTAPAWTPPVAVPSGPCDPERVDLEIDVPSAAVGQGNTATLLLTGSGAAAACTLDITPDSLAVRITSGRDVVWSSSQCPNLLPAKQVVVRADVATAYDFTWNGRRSTDDCEGKGKMPEAGGYWIEAALVGGEPHEAYFDLTGSP